jgi:hypothetical protein
MAAVPTGRAALEQQQAAFDKAKAAAVAAAKRLQQLQEAVQ